MSVGQSLEKITSLDERILFEMFRKRISVDLYRFFRKLTYSFYVSGKYVLLDYDLFENRIAFISLLYNFYHSLYI